MENKVAESQVCVQQEENFSFNRSARIEVRDLNLSSETGALLHRELDHRLGLVDELVSLLHDPRNPHLIQYPLSELVRTRIYLALQGWSDQDDADKLRHDPALRVAVSQAQSTHPLDAHRVLPSQPTLSRANHLLASKANREVLQDGLIDWSMKALALLSQTPEHLTLDLDSQMHETFGDQGGSAYNGHYRQSGYHPQYGYLYETRTFVAAQLRPGNCFTSEGAAPLAMTLLDALEESSGLEVFVRGDCGYADPKLMDRLEDRRSRSGGRCGTPYCFRLRDNRVLGRLADRYLRLPPGPKPQQAREWTYDLWYAAKGWRHKRRVVLVVMETFNPMLPLEWFFLVTNFDTHEMSSEEVLAYYRKRGQMEADLGQWSTALWPSLSCSERVPLQYRAGRTQEQQRQADLRDFHCNEAHLRIRLLAYNLMRMECLLMAQVAPVQEQAQTGHEPDPEHTASCVPVGWSMQRLRDQVLKQAAQFSVRSRYIRVVLSARLSELWLRLKRALDQLFPMTT